MNKTILRFISIFVIGLFLFTAIEVSAQNIFGGTKDFSSSIFLAEAANLDQCANGGIGDPIEPCSGAGWVNGNVNDSKAHWREGDSVAYRQVLTGFTVGNSYSVTIGWDTTKGGLHAIDYLTSFDRTETQGPPPPGGMGNDPCSGVAGCSLGTFTTLAIPTDPNIPLDPNWSGTQIPGVFTLFGGTIDSLSAYSLSGTYTGDSHTNITINFTAGATNMVLAWGGHIATRADWGANNSAVFISGSPYHMSQDNCSFGCGSQDRALSASAVIAAGRIVIIKDSQPDSVINFNFSTTNLGGTNFVLIDDGMGADTDYQTPNAPPFNNIFAFGAANTITVTEASSPNWVIPAGGITCVEVGGTANSTGNPGTQTATIIVEEGETVTCTFINQLTLASAVSVSGRVLTADGYGIGKVYVTAVSLQTGEASRVITNPFGYYQFDGLVVGDYVVSVSSKSYVFVPDTRFISIDDNLSDLDFMASP